MTSTAPGQADPTKLRAPIYILCRSSAGPGQGMSGRGVEGLRRFPIPPASPSAYPRDGGTAAGPMISSDQYASASASGAEAYGSLLWCAAELPLTQAGEERS
jgi:hypothetical protein